MGLKKYIFAAIILIGVAGGYAYNLNLGDYEVHYKQYSLALPIAAWIVAPAVVLFVFSVFHIMWYGMKNYFASKSISKDSATLVKIIAKRLQNEDVNLNVGNDNLKVVAETLAQLNISIEDMSFHSSNKEIKNIAEKILDVKAGKYVSAKELKLSGDNPLAIQNLKNRIILDDNFALEVIKKDSGYSTELVKLAFSKVLDTKSMTTIKKYVEDISFDTEMLLSLLKKDSEQESEFSLSSETIVKLIKSTKVSSEDLIQIARDYKKTMAPDDLIKLYEEIITIDDKYMTAYLYVLSEFQVIDKIREILNSSDNTEYAPFRALIDLRDAGKHSYTLDSICLK